MAQIRTIATALAGTTTFKWTESLSTSGEYHLELFGGGDPSLPELDALTGEGATLGTGTIGSLGAGTWAFGDNDSLGYSTIYLRLASDLDPQDALYGVISGSTEVGRPPNQGFSEVDILDHNTRSVDLFFGRLDTLTTLTADVSPEDMTLSLASTAGFVDGVTAGVFSLEDPDGFYLGKQIGAPAGNVITVDTPVDIPLASGSAVASAHTNLAVDGSVVTQVFQIGPVGANSRTTIDITRIMGHILSSTAMDDGKFGGIAALTNGVVLRKTDGVITNLWNVKSNADLALICYDFRYSDKAPSGQYGCNFRNTYGGAHTHGVIIELLPTEYLEILIQDDLTGLDEFTMMAQGHFKT